MPPAPVGPGGDQVAGECGGAVGVDPERLAAVTKRLRSAAVQESLSPRRQMLADLAEATALSIHLPDDRPGALRELLQVFEQHGVNLASIHSSRTPAGEVHFRIGFEPGLPADVLGHLVAEVNGRGIGRVLSR